MKVNGLDWKIIFTSNDNDLEINDVIHLGVTDRVTKTVYLSDKLEGPLLRKVLVHELTHVWIFSYGYYLTREEEEFLCSFIDTYAEDIINHTDEFIKEDKNGYIVQAERRLFKNGKIPEFRFGTELSQHS